MCKKDAQIYFCVKYVTSSKPKPEMCDFLKKEESDTSDAFRVYMAWAAELSSKYWSASLKTMEGIYVNV